MPADQVTAVRALLDDIVGNDSTGPATRLRRLREVRGDLSFLVGQADSYIASHEKRRDAAEFDTVIAELGARQNADAREAIIRDGGATPDELDQLGVPSHPALDAMVEDGTLAEALEEGLIAWAERLHPRDRMGQWRDTGFERRVKRLERRSGKQIAAGVARRSAPQSPGTVTKPTVKQTGPVPDPAAPRTRFGKSSQKELLAYVNRAASVPTTVDRYSEMRDGRRVYDESRREVHEKIIAELLDGIPAQEQGQARVFFTGGGYAAGKGSVVKKHADALPPADIFPDDPQRALVLDPDRIKAKLPEFDALLAVDPEANLIVYEEAWDISQELQRRAIERNVNVIVDGISNTSADDMLGRVKLFNAAGYQPAKVVYVTIPTDEAVRRARNRAMNAKDKADRRYIPEAIMRAVHRDVSATVPDVIARAGDVGLEVEVWDNDQGPVVDAAGNPVAGKFNPPKRIFAGGAVEDEGLWAEFLAKATEDIDAESAQPPAEQEGALKDAWNMLRDYGIVGGEAWLTLRALKVAHHLEEPAEEHLHKVKLGQTAGSEIIKQVGERLVSAAELPPPAEVLLLEGSATSGWEAPTSAERAALLARSPKAEGVSLKRDGKGLFVHTHRARSKSYPTVKEIPVSVINFVESTG